MTNNEIKSALAALSETMNLLEEEYMENGGEVTEYTEAIESNIERLKVLLTTEGVDSLGRWLKSKEDKIKSLKAEKDAITREIKSCENTIDYIKSEVSIILNVLGVDKVKGTCYSFAPAISTTTSVDKSVLKDMFQESVEKKLRSGKKPVIPADVTVTLGASVKALPEGEETLPAYYIREEKSTCRFTKPRSSKEV